MCGKVSIERKDVSTVCQLWNVGIIYLYFSRPFWYINKNKYDKKWEKVLKAEKDGQKYSPSML